jgi:DNA-binding transcriptional LysR family regulator
MTLIQLEYFCAVCRYGSIARAASELYVSHPTISVALKSLESEFSVKLFIRTSNRLSLTPEGRAFFQKAQDILNHCDEMYAEFAGRPERSYRVHTGIPPIRSTALFPKLLKAFRSEHDVPVVLHEYSSKRAMDKLDAGALDCAMINAEAEDLTSYNKAVLIRDRFDLLVPAQSPLSQKACLTAEDLAEAPLIFQNNDSALNARITKTFDAAGVRPRVVLYASELLVLLDFVSQGLGSAFLYRSMISRDGRIAPYSLEEAGIVPVPFEPELKSTFALIWPKGSYLNANVKTWIAFVKKAFKSGQK